MFGFSLGFSGVGRSNGARIFLNPGWRLTAINDKSLYKSGHNFATGWPIYVVFDK